MNWTKEQEQAISLRGKNIIVSAAAGSGKTAVLVERIRRLTVEEDVSLDRILALTFTNAAASEMKEKIRISLLKEMDEKPEKRVQIKQQLDRLPMSFISTFHAFALRVIRRFFYIADVDAKFKICDEERAKLLKEDAMDAVIEDALSSGDEDIYRFFDCYSSDKDFDALRGVIDELYKQVSAHPDRFDILDMFVEELSKGKDKLSCGRMGAYMQDTIKQTLMDVKKYLERAAEILDESKLSRLAGKVRENDIAIIEELCEKSDIFKAFDEIRAALTGFSLVRLSPKKDEKEGYDFVKDIVASARKEAKSLIDDLFSRYFSESLDDAIYYINETAPHARVLTELTKQFDHEFTIRKRKRHLLDFNDIEHLCLKILRTEEAGRYYRDKFEYILVDEFQDTNLIQDSIIKLIENGRNLFMVGDIKQCIYKFRLVEPEIFRGIYTSYSSEDSEETCAVDLNRNYRSKQPVIDYINRLFFELMQGYDEKAALYCGLSCDEKYFYRPKFDLIDISAKESDDEMEELSEADAYLRELSELEMEAAYVSSIIRKHLGKPFWDSKKQTERLLEPKDIVILLRNTKKIAPVFYSAAKNAGIDITIEEVGGFFENLEIDVFINLLSVIDNRKQDIPLISVLHSDIFGFSSSELAEIRENHLEGKFYDAFSSYDGENSALSAKCSHVMESLSKWKELSKVMPLDDFMWKLMLETGHYIAMGAMPLGAQRQMNLKLLAEKAKDFSESNQSGLFGFLSYLRNLKIKKFDAAQSRDFAENENAVKIMTIHKSKGLEFPMVIVARMSKKLRYSGSKGGVTFQKDAGLGMTYVNSEERWKKKTLMEYFVNDAVKLDEIEEEKRIRYVAMTRARDILYLVGTTERPEKILEKKDFGISSHVSYTDMVIPYIPFEIVKADADELYGSIKGDEDESWAVSKDEILGDSIYSELPDKETENAILDRLNFEYPYRYGRLLKSKYSVSELNKTDALKSGASDKTLTYGNLPEIKKFNKTGCSLSVPAFAASAYEYTAAEAGTVYHFIMEHIDFAKAGSCGKDFVDESIECMVEEGVLLPEEAELIDSKKIKWFFDTDLGKRASRAASDGKLYKEHNFTLNITGEEESYMVQGIIDCYFEEDDGIVLLDYKTNRIIEERSLESEKKRIRKMYEMQMKLYREALEKGSRKPVKEAYLFLADAGVTVRC